MSLFNSSKSLVRESEHVFFFSWHLFSRRSEGWTGPLADDQTKGL